MADLARGFGPVIGYLKAIGYTDDEVDIALHVAQDGADVPAGAGVLCYLEGEFVVEDNRPQLRSV